MQIHWHNPNAVSQAEREDAEQRLLALAEGHSDLIDLWVDVRPNEHHRHGGDEVSIRCQVRGADLVVTRQADEAGIALRDVVHTFERDVHRLRERRDDRRAEPAPAAPVLGIVDRKFPEDGYGFLLTDGGEQVYFHRNALQGGLDFASLQEGERVALEIEAGEQGPQASMVRPPPPGTPGP